MEENFDVASIAFTILFFLLLTFVEGLAIFSTYCQSFLVEEI